MGKIKNFIYLFRILGLKHLLRMKKAHDLGLKYSRGYMVSQCINALFDIGFFETINKEKYLNIREFAESRHLDKKALMNICDYLYTVKIFGRDRELYFLTPEGKILIKDAKGLFHFLYAYAPIFENLPAIITGEKKYGKHIFRRERFVGKASSETEKWLPFIVVKEIIKRYGMFNVLDFGCGDCEFLISLCKSIDKMKCYGVDISQEVINYAKDRVQKGNLSERVIPLVGDIFSFEKLPIDFQKLDAITCMFVLHEFLSDKGKLRSLFNNIRKNLTGNKYIIICELCKQTPKFLRRTQTAVAEHHLFHNLSNQLLATFDEWQVIFKEEGLFVVERHYFDIANQAVFILKVGN